MFVWTGILLDNQLCELKNKAMQIENELDFKPSCHTLPSHISLKISFFIDDDKFDKVVEDITDFYHHLLPFTVECEGIEKEDEIVWLRIKENVLLKCAWLSLNSLLERHFNIPLHPYDCDFKFHSTLFMGKEEQKTTTAYELIKNHPFPEKLTVNRFVIGISEKGMIGSYSIHKEIAIG